MFWKKKPAVGEPSKPKGIPELVGRYLVVDLGRNPHWVWRLKCVMRPRPESKEAFDFRVFDKAQVAAWKVKVKDYNSLDVYPDLIQYGGWFDKKSGTVQIEEKRG